jgi:hypothetical protein
MPGAARLRSALGGLCLLALGCATAGGAGGRFHFFEAAAPSKDDPWFVKVDEWQARERRDRPAETLANRAEIHEAGIHTGLLRVKMGRFEREERLALAKRLAGWAQEESRRHYKFDPPTDVANDPWPTTKDLLDRNGDDCDGLDLITYKLMREFGFPPTQLFRAIVKRERDGANHMVTLWFDDPDDPWVIDATGAVTLSVRRFSQLPGWRPIKVFDEGAQYTPVAAGGDAFATSDPRD